MLHSMEFTFLAFAEETTRGKIVSTASKNPFDRLKEVVLTVLNRTIGTVMMESVSCLVRTTNQSTYRILELGPATNDPNPVVIDTSAKNMTLFRQEWEAMVDRTLEAVTIDTSTTVLKHYGAVKAEFTEFPNIYMMMQCTPDITSGACKICLQESVTYFRDQSWGRQGGGICRPSCVFRWELYAFYGAFANVTRIPAPPRALIPRAKAISITRLKGVITNELINIVTYEII